MSQIIDNGIAMRIVYLLVLPFDKWDAFKYGIIDKDGKPLRTLGSLRTSQEKSSYTMLHRLVSRLKRMLALLPLGRSMMASVAAAYLLIREGVTDETPNLEELFASAYNGIYKDEPQLMEQVHRLLEEVGGDAAAGLANTTANIPPGPVIKVKRNASRVAKKLKKKSKMSEEYVVFIDSNGDYDIIA